MRLPARPRRTYVRSALGAALASALVLGACGSTDEDVASPTDPESSSQGTDTGQDGESSSDESPSGESPSGEGEAGIDTSAVTISNDALGEATEAILELIEQPGTPTDEQAEELFSPEFLAQASGDTLRASFDAVRQAGPTAVTEYAVVSEEPPAGYFVLEGESDLNAEIALNDDGQIDSLLFGEPEDLPEVESLDDVEDVLEERTDEYAIFAGTTAAAPYCQAGAVLGSQDPMPISSQVKVYVLIAVVQAIENGELSWDDLLEVNDEVRSLPSGRLQDADNGTEVSVEEAALRMISESDNTATDMLMAAVGPDALREAVEVTNHENPSALDPMLTTRQLFQIGSDEELLEQWEAAGGGPDADASTTAAREEFLENLPDWDLSVEALDLQRDWGAANWFATGQDLCQAHAVLWELAGTDAGEPVDAIMSANPGLDPEELRDRELVGFKGGSSPGNISGGWAMQPGQDVTYREVLIILTRNDDPASTISGQLLPHLAVAAINDGATWSGARPE